MSFHRKNIRMLSTQVFRLFKCYILRLISNQRPGKTHKKSDILFTIAFFPLDIIFYIIVKLLYN